VAACKNLISFNAANALHALTRSPNGLIELTIQWSE